MTDITYWHAHCIFLLTNQEGFAMDMNFDFQPVYPRHDLLVEIGQVEMAIDGLSEREDVERGALQPDLESRMESLLEALDHLAV
ncbi:hypothetical protein ACFPPA_00380 [Rhodanobacter ginsengisoli]|uniref:Uncharacterized protein n=1 Tax=Rhodanobacter ginsengisoli TaxID=418646 RepID=A0ABW0QHD1_9GAMM